jgi:hypothetical protein
MYIDVQRRTIITGQKKKGARIVPPRALCICCHSLHGSSAGRGALLGLHPLLEGGFRVADRADQLDVGRAITGEPALANQDTLRFRCRAACFGVSKIGAVVGRLAADGSLRVDVLESIGGIPRLERACYPRNCRISSTTAFQLGERSGSVTSTKPSEFKQGFVQLLFQRTDRGPLQALSTNLGVGRAHIWIEKNLKFLRGFNKPTSPLACNSIFP